MKQNNEKESIVVLETVCTIYLLVEQLDDLATQPCFKRTLKHKANILLRELESYANTGVGKALEVDEPLMMELLEQRQKLIKVFATFNEEEINQLAEMINKVIKTRKQTESFQQSNLL